MEDKVYEKVCYVTEQHEENVLLKNRKTGEVGHSYLCTFAGDTVQVRLDNGDLDTWSKEDCYPISEEEDLQRKDVEGTK